MNTDSWGNLTGPDDVRRAEGAMVFIPIGDAGMLICFGGSQDLYGNGTITPQPLNTIFIYDVANTKWYTQNASGRTPAIRRRFCAGATWAQDQSSYNIYLYGGAAFPPNTTGYDDIYILTIPSFQWIRGPYPPNSNVMGPYPKSMMTCNVVDNSQMLIIGGTYSNDTTYMCDADSVWGTHNMNLGEQNVDNAIWAAYLPNLTTDAVPSDILTAIGGQDTGGTARTTPANGYDAPDLSVLMTRKATIATRAPTRNVNINPPSPPPSNPPSPLPSNPLSTGAIAGIAVAGGVVLIAALAGCYVLVRRRRAKHVSKCASSVAQYPGPSASMDGNGGGWHRTPASSPTLTTTSHLPSHHTPPPLQQMVQYQHYNPVAELAAAGAPGVGYGGNQRSMSSTNGQLKFDDSRVQSAELSGAVPGPGCIHESASYTPAAASQQGGFSPPPGSEVGTSFSPRGDARWETYQGAGNWH
ncbi:hypothetical protein GE09DRAFT_1216339 [Coniochaeta sp. 2T2.1]|nr:hypothetical protein GE09DRAFT_1216339 [Coniochaeta sp. 2T2.1]